MTTGRPAARSTSISASHARTFALLSSRRPSRVIVTSSEVGGRSIFAAAANHSSPVSTGSSATTSDYLCSPGRRCGTLGLSSSSGLRLAAATGDMVGRGGGVMVGFEGARSDRGGLDCEPGCPANVVVSRCLTVGPENQRTSVGASAPDVGSEAGCGLTRPPARRWQKLALIDERLVVRGPPSKTSMCRGRRLGLRRTPGTCCRDASEAQESRTCSPTSECSRRGTAVT